MEKIISTEKKERVNLHQQIQDLQKIKHSIWKYFDLKQNLTRDIQITRDEGHIVRNLEKAKEEVGERIRIFTNKYGIRVTPNSDIDSMIEEAMKKLQKLPTSDTSTPWVLQKPTITTNNSKIQNINSENIIKGIESEQTSKIGFIAWLKKSLEEKGLIKKEEKINPEEPESISVPKTLTKELSTQEKISELEIRLQEIESIKNLLDEFNKKRDFNSFKPLKNPNREEILLELKHDVIKRRIEGYSKRYSSNIIDSLGIDLEISRLKVNISDLRLQSRIERLSS